MNLGNTIFCGALIIIWDKTIRAPKKITSSIFSIDMYFDEEEVGLAKDMTVDRIYVLISGQPINFQSSTSLMSSVIS
jgi:hypothetical protein